MSAKYFCDVCDREIDGRKDRVRRRLGDVTVEIMVAVKNTWNVGHICEPCVVKVVIDGEPAGPDCGYLASKARARTAA